jgi:hypothetical protein
MGKCSDVRYQTAQLLLWTRGWVCPLPKTSADCPLTTRENVGSNFLTFGIQKGLDFFGVRKPSPNLPLGTRENIESFHRHAAR